jgi:Tol biopolymer transport system component
VTYDPIWSPNGQEIIFLEGSFNGSGTYIVKADVPFDQQAPRLVPRMGEGDDAPRFRASDWSAITDRIAGRSVDDGTVTLYSPATDTFEALGHRGNDPRWLSDGQGVYYQRAGLWFAVDMATRTERAITLPERVPEFRLSPDSARAYWLSFRVQSDIWMLEIR